MLPVSHDTSPPPFFSSFFFFFFRRSSPFFFFLRPLSSCLSIFLQDVSWPPWERHDVSNVRQAGGEQDETLKAEAKAGVRNAAVVPKIAVPFHVLWVDVEILHLCLKHVNTFLTLRSANKLADLWDQHVHGRHRLPWYTLFVVVEPHVERLDLGWVVVHDDWTFKHFLCKVPFVLGTQINTPRDFLFKRLLAFGHVLDQERAGVGVRDSGKRGGGDLLAPVDAGWVHLLCKELELWHAVLKHKLQAELHVLLGALHVSFDVTESNLWLNPTRCTTSNQQGGGVAHVQVRDGVAGAKKPP